MYGTILNIGFLSDDYGFVYQMETYGWKAFEHNFNDPFFIPVSHFIAASLYTVFDGSPLVFHSIQLVVHSLIAWQLFLVLKEFKSKANFALLVGVIFLIMPYQTESVVWLAAKSYGYSLFFSLLSVRYFFKWYIESSLPKLILHFLFLILAILSKEMAYILPLLILVLFFMLYHTTKLSVSFDKKKWIVYGLITASILAFSFGVRFYVLKQWVGGYGSDVHTFDSATMITHFCAWVFKYGSFYRFAIDSLVFFFISIFIVATCFIGFVIGIKKQSSKLTHLIGFFLLLFLLLLPILHLEITSVKSIASDRYGYFANAVIAVVLSFSLFSFNLSFKRFLVPLIFTCFIGFTLIDGSKWKASSQLCHNYLNELVKQDIEGKNILLVNVPDNFDGAYCLRNGIKDFVALIDTSCKITPVLYQTFNDLSGGIYPINNTFMNAPKTQFYYSNPLFIDNNPMIWNDSLLKEYDRTFYYVDGKMETYFGSAE